MARQLPLREHLPKALAKHGDPPGFAEGEEAEVFQPAVEQMVGGHAADGGIVAMHFCGKIGLFSEQFHQSGYAAIAVVWRSCAAWCG